ncbi:hypothetical protein V491_08405 [Pseudogymnoascus sp. VKM F-3775]|nr:hypothetical protein V491_08405 [Pseudogymnoascus sp. VKM F-3775]
MAAAGRPPGLRGVLGGWRPAGRYGGAAPSAPGRGGSAIGVVVRSVEIRPHGRRCSRAGDALDSRRGGRGQAGADRAFRPTV